MSIFNKIIETVLQATPDKKPDKLIQQKEYIGRPMDRVDGRLKVTGEAKFTAEYGLENLCYAAIAYSSIAKGKIKSLDVSEAEKADGVLTVITHQNSPKMDDPLTFSPGGRGKGTSASDLPIMQDNRVEWNGHPIAVVIAQTQEAADYAATLVKAEYDIEDAATSFDGHKSEAKTPPAILGEPGKIEKGNAEEELKKAAFKIDHVYHTPKYNHNAIEPHASIAHFKEDGSLLLFDSTQNLWGMKATIADIFSLKPEQVQVVAPFVGGGFGGKGTMWMNTALCAMAAKQTGRPVKLALSREGVFRIVGGRTRSEQRVAIGADSTGKFVSVIHTGFTATTDHNNFPEQFSFPVRHLYASKSFYIEQKALHLNTVANTFMRAPGESIGTYALESAIDELAHLMNMDPIELRILNEPEKDPVNETEFSSRHLVEAYRRGAKKFGWKHAPPRSQKSGEWLVGQGVATAMYPVYRMPASAKISLFADGTAVIKAAAHDMGMGTATVQLQGAADRLGLTIEKVSFQYGDSDLPQSPGAGGSNQTVSISAAVAATAENLVKTLFDLAKENKSSPLSQLKLDDVELKNGGVFSKKDESVGQPYADILKAADKAFVEAEGSGSLPIEIKKYSMHSYGAQFAEVRVNEVTGEVRVSRWVGSFDTGRILNPKTALSQFRGGIIMGIGMALTEETFFDERAGRIVNATLAEYHLPVNADVPHIDVIYNDIPDPQTPLGAHGIGEIGITGAAAAIANAVFNATGKRVRDLPITLDKLLDL